MSPATRPTGPRVFTVEQVDRLLPELESRFAALDQIRERMRASKIRIDALEMIWGEKLASRECTDHGEYLHPLEELKQLEEEFRSRMAACTDIGATVKGVEPGLVDFYGVRDGYLVYLCWKRGEERCGHWHPIDAGFAGRKPL